VAVVVVDGDRDLLELTEVTAVDATTVTLRAPEPRTP
jgi:hypothetical protein